LRRKIGGLGLVATLCGASALLAAPAHSAAVSAKPHGLELLMNGKKLPITALGGPDRYNAINAGHLRVQAKWHSSLTGTPYRVQIQTTEPTVRTWRTCSTGRSCRLKHKVRMLAGEQMSWTVRLVMKKRHFLKVLSAFMVCLTKLPQ